MASQLHIISINTQGLRDFNKRSRLREWAHSQKSDILFLQETHFTYEIENEINN